MRHMQPADLGLCSLGFSQRAKGFRALWVVPLLACSAVYFLLDASASTDDLVLGYVRTMGGSGFSRGHDITIDSADNLIITGEFGGTCDFDPGPGTASLTSTGSRDAFVCKLDDSGNFLWVHSLGASNGHGYGVAVDSDDNVLVTGQFYGTADFDPGPGTFSVTANSSGSAYLWKLSSLGDLVWAVSLDRCTGRGVVVDQLGNAVIAGVFSGTVDFDPGPGVVSRTSAGGGDVFAVKLDSTGTLHWAVTIGGEDGDTAHSIFLDDVGNLYVTGRFTGSVDFDPGPGISLLSGDEYGDVFVCKLDPAGTFLWAVNIRDGHDDSGWGIEVDALGNVYCTGFFQSVADFDPGPGTLNLTSTGYTDSFAWKLSSTGELLWAKRLGGTNRDLGFDLVLDTSGSLCIVGYFQSTIDFDPGPGTVGASSVGNTDAYLWRLDTSGNLLWAGAIGGTDQDELLGVISDAVGNVYATGGFRSPADYDPGPGEFHINNVGPGDISLIKLEPQILPTANPDTGETNADEVLISLSSPDIDSVLANDTDGNSRAILTVTAFDATSAFGAMVQVNADGSFLYDPTAVPDFQALVPDDQLEDSFTYVVSDGIDSSVGLVTITVYGTGTGLPGVGSLGLAVLVLLMVAAGSRSAHRDRKGLSN